jgi:methionyl-tRNA formyltransferase
MNIVFMGTPHFAVPTLHHLVNSDFTVRGVVCQPDRPQGRGQKIQVGPVKALALVHQIPVFQPLKMKDPALLETLAEWNPAVIVVAAFGRILPPVMLELPSMGCLNVHGSLLPKYRGAAPIQWAVLNGEKETGVTIMKMDEGMDTGPILRTATVSIGPEETSGELAKRMAEIGGGLLLETLRDWVRGEVTPQSQKEEDATLAPMLKKEDGLLDWTRSADELVNRIRGLSPWPGAYTFLQGNRLGIWKGKLQDDTVPGADDFPAGAITQVNKGEIVVKTGEGMLKVLEIQPANKNRMQVAQFLAGHRVEPGMVFAKGPEKTL